MKACSSCGTQNDFTRVFCANCGTRLPEGESPAGQQPATATPARSAPPLPAPVRRKPIKPALKRAEHGLVGLLARELILMAALGAILAGMIQMAREPDGIPPRSSANAAVVRETFATLRQMSASPRPISWTVNQNAVNEFLATTIRMEASDLAGKGAAAKFRRSFVRFQTGRLTLGVEQEFLGRSLYFLADVVPAPTAQGMEAKVAGGAIGRLPVHPVLLPNFLRLFQPTITDLAQPLEVIRRAKSVTVQPADVTLQWAGSP